MDKSIIMNKDCVVYLLRSSQDDIEMLNKSLNLLDNNLLRFTKNCDVIIFHESDLGELRNGIQTNIDLQFHEIVMGSPKYAEDIASQIPEFFPHPTHGNGPIAWGHPGFTIGYRNMCRFFSGEFHKQEVLQNYKYYLRLDTDSYILTPLNYDIFEFARNNDLNYGYCAPAVQIDTEKVISGFNNFTKEYLNKKNPTIYVDVDSIPEGKMFYTNFELGKVSWFLESQYWDFYNAIDESGYIYIRRWGDAPIKYMGVTLFCEPGKIIPVKGFTYQHGAVYRL